MSLIETCRRNGVNAFEYLTALIKTARRIAQDPAAWLPWTYQASLAAAASHDRAVEHPPPVVPTAVIDQLRGTPTDRPDT